MMSKLPWGNSKKLTCEEFYNRTEEINLLTNILKTTSKSNAPNILLTGIRSVGKTVLLNRIKEIMDKEYLVINMDFSMSQTYQKNNMSVEGILDYYYNKIVKECKKRQLNTLDTKINKFFKTNNFLLKDVADIEHVPIPIISSQRDLNKYTEFVFNLPEEIYNKNKNKIKGIIIFIDEFQIIKELGNFLESFLWVFRGYVTEQRNVAYLLSGSMSLQDKLITEIAGQNGAFGGRMITIHINPFSKECTQKYLKEKAPELTFTVDGFERFYKCTSGVPAYINIFGRLLPANTVLDEKIIINHFDNNLSLILTHLIIQWNNLTEKEKDIIIALLDKPLKRIEIANKLKVESGSLSEKLNKLLNQGLITNMGGKYKINEPLLKRWLIKEYERNEIYPYKLT